MNQPARFINAKSLMKLDRRTILALTAKSLMILENH